MKKIIFICLVSLIIIFYGTILRLSTNIYTPAEFYAKNNVVSYYVHISKRLIFDGKIPKMDKWRYSNEEHVENAPPFLAILTSSSYKFIRVFNIDPEVFMAYFNIILYIALIIVGSLYLYIKFASLYPIVIFQLLLSFLPFSKYLQNYGRYTEEFLGVFLIILASICEIERENSKYWKYFEILFLVFLLLTWQQFHLIIFVILVSNIIFRRYVAKETLVIIVAAFIISEFVSRVIFNSNYSPIYMIYESIYPFIKSSDRNIIKIAMSRRDWGYLTWSNAVDYFSYAGILIFLFSIINFFVKKPKKYSDKYLILGTLCTLCLTIFFVKSRYLMIPYVLLFCSFNYQCLVISNTKQLFEILKFTATLAILAIFIFFGVNYKLLINQNYSPQIDNRIDSIKLDNGKSKVILYLKNIGENQTPDKDSFAGYHIEVFNAKVTNITSKYYYGKDRIVQKSDAQMKDYYWFEVKYYSFDKNKYAEVTFETEKIDMTKPIIVKYRSWIPGYCSIVHRYETMSSLVQGYSEFNNSWRNEECIIRSPTNESTKNNECSYKVYAAHVQRQDFKCYEKVF